MWSVAASGTFLTPETRYRAYYTERFAKAFSGYNRAVHHRTHLRWLYDRCQAAGSEAIRRLSFPAKTFFQKPGASLFGSKKFVPVTALISIYIQTIV